MANVEDLGNYLTKVLAWDFNRFSVPVETTVKNDYWIVSCEFFQGKKERWFYKLRMIVCGNKEAYITYNCLTSELGEDLLQKELIEVNQIFDSFEFV